MNLDNGTSNGAEKQLLLLSLNPTHNRQECDTIALFMESMLVKCGEGEWIKTSNLYNDYRKWYTSCDIEGKSQKEFVDTLRQKGLLSRHSTDGHIVRGYKMKPAEDEKETQKKDKIHSISNKSATQ